MYVGRGFNFTGEIITAGLTMEGFVLAFIGTFDIHPPSPGQIAIYNNFLEKSSDQGLLTDEHTMASDHQITSSNQSSAILDLIKESENFHSCKF